MRLNAVWVGESLSYIEQLCLTSALDVGHQVTLWTYDQVGGVPAGVDIGDASEVMPREMMIKHDKASYAVGADLFRLLLQKQQRGCYVDCDMLLLKPIPDGEYIFGFQNHKRICNAVLRLPSECPIISETFAMLDGTPIIAPWWSTRKQIKQRVNAVFGRDLKIDNLPWLTLGPGALTYFAERFGLAQYASAPEVFYPNPPRFAAEMFAPSADVRRRITPDTVAVHLWHSLIVPFKGEVPPEGSFIHEQCVRLKLDLKLATSQRWRAQ